MHAHAWRSVAAALVLAIPVSAATLNGALPPPSGDFEQNRGQLDRSIRYVTRGDVQTLLFRDDGVTLSPRPSEHEPASDAALQMRFAGARPDASVAGEDLLATKSHYLIGADPRAWHIGVPHFARVRYREIYPRTDAVFAVEGSATEYRFELAAGADPRRIDLAFDGASRIDVDRDGALVLRTPRGEIRHGKPVAYYADTRRTIVARYVVHGARDVRIELDRYDRRRPIVIDPVVVFYSTYLGGTGSDKALGLAVDAAGSAYVAGLTGSIDFPTANAAQPASGGATDAFVARLDASGTGLIYATYLGGSGIDAASAIAIDAAGNAYVAGYTASPDFPVIPSALQAVAGGGAYDAFVVKLAADGTPLYATYLGGSGLDQANAIAVDAAGRAYVAGVTCSGDFPVANAFQPQLDGVPIGCFAAADAFVAKLDASGAALVYSTYFGGSGADEANAIAVDGQGRAAITGGTRSTDFPTLGVPVSAYAGSSDAFVARFDAAGGIDYSTYAGGADDDEGDGIAVDAAGALYVAGTTRSTDFPLAKAFQTSLHGSQDAFAMKIVAKSASEVSIAYASYLGGSDDETARAVVVDANANAYVTGSTASLDFPLIAATQATLAGAKDAFVVRIGANGTPSYATFLGGNDVDEGWSVALGPGLMRYANTIYVAGTTSSTDLATSGAVQQVLRGAVDGFVAKLGYVP